jgi:hypothetical protein
LTGWKSKYGGILVAIGAALGSSAALIPIEKMKSWLVFLGVLLGGIGTGLLGVGIAHKVEKSAAAKEGGTPL